MRKRNREEEEEEEELLNDKSTCSVQLHVQYMYSSSLHALSCLSADVNELVHLKLVLLHMDVSKESGAITPLGDNSQLGLAGPAHEQQDVGMASLSRGRRGGEEEVVVGDSRYIVPGAHIRRRSVQLT